MEAYVQQIYHNAPEALRTEDNLAIIATRLAQGLTQAAWRFGRETRRKASGT
jgi:hypothetical protein